MRISSDLRQILSGDLEELLEEAFAVRIAQSKDLIAAVPGAKRYRQAGYSNSPTSFLHASVTGTECALNCRHCRKILLESMVDVSDPAQFTLLRDRMLKKGCNGLLLSGGSQKDGTVDFSKYLTAIAELTESGIKVIVHTGLVGREQAESLAKAGISQALIDVIGDKGTIKAVCGLNAAPDDYYTSVDVLLEANLEVVPHIIVGLDNDSSLGEACAAGEMLKRPIAGLVFVAFRDFAKSGLPEPAPEHLAKLCAGAKLSRPDLGLALGCMRPSLPGKSGFEILAIKAGVNSIAFPRDETVESARNQGLNIFYQETCCSLGLTAGVTKKMTEELF